MANFDLAQSLRHYHLVVQPSDLALDPPESYLLVQDGLIIVCGVLYTMCYLFYMTRTYKDKHLAGSVEYLCGTMAYELFYAFATTSTSFELGAFLVWFLFDATFALVAIFSAYPRTERRAALIRVILGVAVGVAVLRFLTTAYPDEREQVTAYWTGILLQFPIGWGSVYLLLRDGSTRGHSLEIWTTRYLGTLTAYAVFFWRYLNIPQNWAYVASPLSLGIIVLTLLPETVYPFIYVWAHAKQRKREAGLQKIKGT